MKKAIVFTELHLAVLLFGFAGLLGKLISLPPVSIVWGRTLFAAMTLSVILWKHRISLLHIKYRDLAGLALSGVLLAVHWTSFFYTIQISTVAIGLITFATFPVFVTFLEPLFFRERLRPVELLSAGIVTAGLILIVPRFNLSDRMTLGVCWGTFSGLTFAILALINRHYVRRIPALTVTFFQQAGAAVITLPLVMISRITPGLKDTGLLLILGVICTAVAQLLYIRSLKVVKAQTAAVIFCLEPLYGIVLAWLIIQEIPAGRTLIGGLLILAAVFVAMRKPAVPHPKRSAAFHEGNP